MFSSWMEKGTFLITNIAKNLFASLKVVGSDDLDTDKKSIYTRRVLRRDEVVAQLSFDIPCRS